MGFWSAILGFFGIKTKAVKEEEARKEDNLRRIREGFEKKEVYKVKSSLDNITGEDSEQIEKQLKEEEAVENLKREEDLRGRLTEKIKKIKDGKPSITAEYKKKAEEAINPQNIVIETGNITSHQELQDSKYDIYRNIILQNISSDKMVQEIYQSGILKEHIICELTIYGYASGYKTDFKYTPTKQTIEIKGLTPDKTLELGLLLRLKGFEGSVQSLKDIINKSGVSVESQLIEDDRHQEYKIDNVDVKYNYA